jgi:hypothetical protein
MPLLPSDRSMLLRDIRRTLIGLPDDHRRGISSGYSTEDNKA